MKKFIFISKIGLILTFLCYINHCTDESDLSRLRILSESNGFISIHGERFIDPDGRQIIFHGINLVNKNKSQNYLGDETGALFKKFKDWGFNCIRLGIIWDGVEPEPGTYDENYLKGIDQRIAWAKQNDLYVILDMHQDLFSVKFSDGAPEWATITEGKPHINISPVWSDAYFSSPAVQTAFDHFWNNTPATDGIGIQDHYANAWKYVAKRYAKETAVIGIDIMNEPFLGSPAAQIQPLMIAKGAEIFANIDGPKAKSPEELAQMWVTPSGRSYILNRLSDVSIYAQIIDVTQPIYAQFESTKLMDMYKRVTRAIREVNQHHIVFLETTIASNMGVYTGINPIKDDKNSRDPLQAYAPHGYDLVTDTEEVATGNQDRIKFIFDRHGDSQKRLQMPMIVGEWGAYGLSKNALASAQVVVGQFEKLLCGETYWAYEKNIETTDHFHAISRPFPDRISGTLNDYSFDFNNNTFTSSWIENEQINKATLIYIPNRFSLEKSDIKLIPKAGGFTLNRVTNNSVGSYLEIPSSNKNITRNLVVRLK